jgi:hypothetical protein
MESNSVATVQEWQAAVNAQDRERLLALSASTIEIVGPRGSGFGHQLLSDWLERAGLSITARRIFARADSVVVEQHGTWRAPQTGAVAGEAEMASHFRADAGQVGYFARYDSLEAALAAAGLSAADEVKQD